MQTIVDFLHLSLSQTIISILPINICFLQHKNTMSSPIYVLEDSSDVDDRRILYASLDKKEIVEFAVKLILEHDIVGLSLNAVVKSDVKEECLLTLEELTRLAKIYELSCVPELVILQNKEDKERQETEKEKQTIMDRLDEMSLPDLRTFFGKKLPRNTKINGTRQEMMSAIKYMMEINGSEMFCE